MSRSRESVVILDYGSQYTQLIARRVREHHVYCRILTPEATGPDTLRAINPKGLILSGGPASVYGADVPMPDPKSLALGIPVLGICYGMQAMAKLLGGHVEATGRREYGKAVLMVDEPTILFRGVKESFVSWMSHGDSISDLPPGFRALAHTDTTKAAAIGDPSRSLYGLQFHPEVIHTEEGEAILRNFLFGICGCRGDWTMSSFVEEAVGNIRSAVGDAHVVIGVSGGVDSSVTAALVHQAVGDHLTCIFIDNGLLRSHEREEVERAFREQFKMNLRVVDARERFLTRLRGVEDPEQKRKIIGEVFIRVFEEEARQLPNVKFLAQGTLYPDCIESRSTRGGPSATIKTHHNVGGLPEKMALKLVEPLRELFKDEVRDVGRVLGLPAPMLQRHPFPGPGLAVRILGEVTEERLRIVREADARVLEELRATGMYESLWQAFAVLLPVKTVGVMGDERTYEHVIAVRAVTSQDAMTADWARLPHELLERIATRIINEVHGVNRVVYDISSKPPSTIEWE